MWYLHLSVKVSHLSCLSNPAVGVRVGLFNINFAALFEHHGRPLCVSYATPYLVFTSHVSIKPLTNTLNEHC